MTIITLRPDTDNTNNWHIITSGGSQNRYGALSDNSDTTYIYATSGANGDSYTYAAGFTTTTLAANQRVYGITSRIRGWTDFNYQNARTIDVVTKYGVDMSTIGVGRWTSAKSTPTISTNTGTTALTKPGGGEWDQIHINFLVLQLTFHLLYSPQASAADSQNVSAAYLDVDIRSQPVVTGQGASNFTNFAQPTVDWTFNDPDNNPQSHYWVRVFDQATVNNPGFSPATSSAAWDSGIQSSSATSITIDTPLQNNVTYVAYVRAAKWFPLSNSQQSSAWKESTTDYKWWSVWAPTGTFTVTYSAPLAPQITNLQVLSDSNQYRAVINTFIPVNMLSADSSTLEAAVGDWKSLSNCAVVRSTTKSALGAASLRMTATGSGDMSAYADGSGTGTSTRIPVDPGATYTVLASFSAGTTGRTCQVGVRWHKADGTSTTVYGTTAAPAVTGGYGIDPYGTSAYGGSGGVTSGSTTSSFGSDTFGASPFGGGTSTGGGGTIVAVLGSVVDSTAGFLQASATMQAPAGSIYADVVLLVIGAAANEIHYVDNISIHAGSTLTWMPGGYLNTYGDLVLERCEFINPLRGPASNLMSLQVASAGTNNKSIEGFSYNTTASQLIWLWLDQAIPSPGDTPAGMLRWSPLTTSTSVALEISNRQTGSSTQGSGTDFNIPVLAGLQYTFSCWAWTDMGTATIQVQPSISWRDPTGNTVLSSDVGPTYTLTNIPQLISVTAYCPGNGSVLASGRITNVSGDNTKHIFLTRFGFGRGTDPVDSHRAQGYATSNWQRVRFLGDDNPLTKSDARFLNPSTLPPGPYTAQRETISDYEYPAGRTVLYRASITYTVAGISQITSPYSNIVAAWGSPPPVTLVRSVIDPTLQVAVNRRKEMSFSITEDAQIFHPLGANAAPVKVRDWVGGEDGQLIVVIGSDAQYKRLRELMISSDTLLVQWAQGGRTYIFITGDRSVDDMITSDIQYCDADGRHDWLRRDIVTLSYLETAAP